MFSQALHKEGKRLNILKSALTVQLSDDNNLNVMPFVSCALILHFNAQHPVVEIEEFPENHGKV